MRDTMASSWRDPRYLTTLVGLVTFGVLVFYAGLTNGPPAPESVAIIALFIGVAGWLWQFLSARLS
jgi:hypothetical protein